MLKIDNHTLLSSLDYLNIAQAETYSLIKELSVDTGAPCPVGQSVGNEHKSRHSLLKWTLSSAFNALLDKVTFEYVVKGAKIILLFCPGNDNTEQQFTKHCFSLKQLLRS